MNASGTSYGLWPGRWFCQRSSDAPIKAAAASDKCHAVEAGVVRGDPMVATEDGDAGAGGCTPPVDVADGDPAPIASVAGAWLSPGGCS